MKKEVVKVTKTEPVVKKKKVVVVSSSRSLSELHALRLRLEAAEGSLSQHVHICFGEDGFHDCGVKITQLEVDTQTQKYKQTNGFKFIHYNNWTCACMFFFVGRAS